MVTNGKVCPVCGIPEGWTNARLEIGDSAEQVVAYSCEHFARQLPPPDSTPPKGCPLPIQCGITEDAEAVEESRHLPDAPFRKEPPR